MWSPRGAFRGFRPGGGSKRALANPIGLAPLADLVKAGSNVVLLVDDMTRSTPQKVILPAILDALNQAGVQDEEITAIISLGTHRPMTDAEILERYGRLLSENQVL